MKQLFNFKRLIKKYSVPIVNCLRSQLPAVMLAERGYRRRCGTKMINGAVIPMTTKKIYQSGGTYTEQDRELSRIQRSR